MAIERIELQPRPNDLWSQISEGAKLGCGLGVTAATSLCGMSKLVVAATGDHASAPPINLPIFAAAVITMTFLGGVSGAIIHIAERIFSPNE